MSRKSSRPTPNLPRPQFRRNSNSRDVNVNTVSVVRDNAPLPRTATAIVQTHYHQQEQIRPISLPVVGRKSVSTATQTPKSQIEVLYDKMRELIL